MHLANGTLANDVCTVTAAISAAGVGYAAIRARASATPARLLRAAIGSGIVLVAQMIDITLFNHMTVHVIGAAFLTLLAGPALALLGMTAVVAIQALVLNDGGITVLGANVLNMGVVAVAVSAVCVHALRSRLGSKPGLLLAAPIAGAASVAAAILAMAAELAASGVSFASVLSITMPAHAPFAAWESLATLALVQVAAYAGAIEPAAQRSSSS
jgi:cobalt/nickel transport system permease protein